MSLLLSAEQLASIEAAGRASYPHECCGVLVGVWGGGPHKRVRDLRPVANAREDSPQNRYLIPPEEFLRVTREAEAEGLEVVGFYHSHPDVEARPSRFDRDHAWPGYSYVIVSVRGGKPRETTSWVLSPDREEFESEVLEVLDAEPEGTARAEGVS